MSFRAQRGAPLTVDKVIEALKGVRRKKPERWLWIGMKFLLLSQSKLAELTSSCVSEEDCLRTVVHFWLSRCPYASWRWLLWSLECKALLEISDKIDQYAETLTDSTLTVENVSTVVSTVTVDVLREFLDVPQCKENEILRSGTIDERKRCLISWWLEKSPFASWEKLAGCLYHHEEWKALEEIKQFFSRPEQAVNFNEFCDIVTVGKKWTVCTSLRLLTSLHIPKSAVKRFHWSVYFFPSTSRLKCYNFEPHIRHWMESHPALSWRGVAYALYLTAGFVVSDSVDCYDVLEVINKKCLQKDINLQDLCKEAILSFVQDEEDIDLLPLPKRMKLNISH